MFIPKSSIFKLFFIVLFVDVLENVLESSIVFFHNCVLGGQITWHVSGESLFETFVSETSDGFIGIVHTHQNTWGFKVVNFHSLFLRTIFWSENNLELTGFVNDSISSSILISESMSSNNDWFSPSWNKSWNILAKNWLSEDSSSKIVSNCTIW